MKGVRSLAPYQAGEKQLIAEYFNCVFIRDHCKGWYGKELTMDSFDLPFPIWIALSRKYLDTAQEWKREQLESQADGCIECGMSYGHTDQCGLRSKG